MTYNTTIHIASIILPFSNEIANVFTSSKLPLFSNLYKECIDPYLLSNNVLNKISTNKTSFNRICKRKNIYSKLLIDIIALFGIILNIGKNSILYGYLTGILSGLNVVLFSFILPNLFLHKILHYIAHYFNIKNSYMLIFIGFICICILMVVSGSIENIIQKKTTGIIIDTDIE